MSVEKDFILSLTETDKEAIRSIYLLRCLDENILYEMFYAPKGRSRDYVMRRVRNFVKNDIIERVKYGEEYPALFLTTTGIGLLRFYLNLPEEVYLKENKKTNLGVYNSDDLKLDIKVIKHQIHLNTFVAKFKKRADEMNLQWSYYDEKYLSKYTSIRPDGMIRIGTEDIFLEMDMGTETNRQLKRKWENYRNFYNSDEYFHREQNIKVLFIVGNIKNTKLKARRVKSLIYDEIIDLVDTEIDFYVDDQDSLIDTIFKRLIPQSPYINDILMDFKTMMTKSWGFLFSSGDRLSNILNDAKFNFYIRKLNHKKKILIQDGEPQEFVVDLYVGKPMSILKKIAYMKKTSANFENAMKRPLKYIVVIEENTEEDFYLDLKEMGIVPPENVYFTTDKRVRNMLFYEALFQYNALGSIVHFTDNALSGKVHERSI